MKKFLVSALAAFVILASGSAFAQTTVDTATHDVTISIPNVAFLRFTETVADADRTAVVPDAVQFTLTIADVEGTVAIAPSNAATANWGDLKVFVNYDDTWQVTVTAADTSTGTAGAFEWDKVGVGSWNIASGTVAASGFGGTGWTSLGFGAADFRLTLEGDEVADSNYSATVTYTLAIF